MVQFTNLLIAVLRPFLAGVALVIFAMLAFLVVQRGVDESMFQRRRAIIAKYRATIDAPGRAREP